MFVAIKWFGRNYLSVTPKLNEVTCILWWIEDHLPFVDEHGEPVVRDYEKEDINNTVVGFVTDFLKQGMEEGDGTHGVTDFHDRFPHSMDYTVLYRWWPAEDSVYCPNCGTNFPADDLDMNFCYIGEDDERYTEENDGVLCVFCEEVDA